MLASRTMPLWCWLYFFLHPACAFMLTNIIKVHLCHVMFVEADISVCMEVWISSVFPPVSLRNKQPQQSEQKQTWPSSSGYSYDQYNQYQNQAYPGYYPSWGYDQTAAMYGYSYPQYDYSQYATQQVSGQLFRWAWVLWQTSKVTVVVFFRKARRFRRRSCWKVISGLAGFQTSVSHEVSILIRSTYHAHTERVQTPDGCLSLADFSNFWQVWGLNGIKSG